MEEGLVGFLSRWYYWVGIGIALVATFFAFFFPPAFMAMIVLIILIAFLLMYHYWKYELMKMDRRPFKPPPPKTSKVQDVEAVRSERIDIGRIAAEASRGPRRVRANLIEGSGMDLVERYVPLYEMLFPVSFIADRTKEAYQEGSLEVGSPLCLWHTVPVTFSPNGDGKGPKWTYQCPKCRRVAKAIDRSIDEAREVIALIAASSLREGKMPIRDETLLEAVKRGRGELPG